MIRYGLSVYKILGGTKGRILKERQKIKLYFKVL